MGKQIALLMLPEDELEFVKEAASQGAAFVGRRGQEASIVKIGIPFPEDLHRQCYLWARGLDLPELGSVRRGLSTDYTDAIEFTRCGFASDVRLVSGRLFMTGHKLLKKDDTFTQVPHESIAVNLFNHLRKWVRGQWVGHKGALETYYLGPAALKWHRNGGRLKIVGSQEELSI